MLVLTTEALNQTVDGQDYYVVSGAVNSSGRFAHHYGLFEARLKLPDVYTTSGYTLHSSFWLLEDEGCHQELDILEQYAVPGPSAPPHRRPARLDPPRRRLTTLSSHLTGQPNVSKVAGNVHSYGPSGTCNKADTEVQYNAHADFTSEWHIFGLDWRADSLKWYIDGTMVANYTGDPLYVVPVFVARGTRGGGGRTRWRSMVVVFASGSGRSSQRSFRTHRTSAAL